MPANSWLNSYLPYSSCFDKDSLYLVLLLPMVIIVDVNLEVNKIFFVEKKKKNYSTDSM